MCTQIERYFQWLGSTVSEVQDSQYGVHGYWHKNVHLVLVDYSTAHPQFLNQIARIFNFVEPVAYFFRNKPYWNRPVLLINIIQMGALPWGSRWPRSRPQCSTVRHHTWDGREPRYYWVGHSSPAWISVSLTGVCRFVGTQHSGPLHTCWCSTGMLFPKKTHPWRKP
jgi:hypothetical protein